MPVRRGVLLGFIAPVIAFAQLHVSVSDKAGNPVLDLPQSAFHLYVDRVEQPIGSFRPNQVPISMGLVVDNGARMRDQRQPMLTALRSTIASSDLLDEMFILGYNTATFMDQEFTNDRGRLDNALPFTETRGFSAMRDAVDAAIDYTDKHAKNPTKVLFVIAGGDDDTSRVKMEDLARKAKSSGIAIYGIGLLNGRDRDEKKRAQNELRALSEASGGLDSYPRGAVQADDAILKFAGQIRNEYLLGYAPVPGQPKVVVDLPGLTVRLRSSN